MVQPILMQKELLSVTAMKDIVARCVKCLSIIVVSEDTRFFFQTNKDAIRNLWRKWAFLLF